MWELTKSFRFEAAHALPGTTLGGASEEIHAADQNIQSRLSSEPFQPLDVLRHVSAPTEKRKH